MVYRPPKKKPEGTDFPRNRPAADPLEGPLSGPASGDDRNLVVVDDNYVGGDFEDRMWLFWSRQSGNIVRIILVACLVVIGWQGWKLYQAHLVTQLQEEYQAAADGPSLLAFAQAHADSQFGKLAQIEAADAFYKAGQFKDAAKAYEQAAIAWSGDNNSQRARVGQGLSLLQSGQVDDGKKLLETMANDTQAMENFRAEASFYLAVLAVQAGDLTEASKWTDKIDGFKSATSWISQAKMLTDSVAVSGGKPITSMASPVTTPAPMAAPAMTTKPAASSSTEPAPLTPPKL